MCAVRQGPTNRNRVGLPRSGSRDKGVGPIGGDQLTGLTLINLAVTLEEYCKAEAEKREKCSHGIVGGGARDEDRCKILAC